MTVKHSIYNAFGNVEKKRQRLRLKHTCQLPDANKNLLIQYIDSGYCVDLRRKFRSFMMSNEKNPRSKLFLRSSAAIQMEKQNHLQFYYYMIHPFSLARVIWEVFMMIILCLLLVYIPLDVCFSRQANDSNRIPRICLDIICVVDICMSFLTGYQDSMTKKVIMAPKRVAINYVKTWFGLDVISSLNADVLIIIFQKMSKNALLLKIPSFLKIFRLATLLKYMERFREWKQYSLYKFKLMKLALLMILMVIWNTCVLYLIAKARAEVWMPTEKIQGQTSSSETWEGLRLSFIRIIMNFLLVSNGERNSERLEIISLEVVWLSVGWVIKLAVTAQIVQIVMKYSSLSDKYYQMVQQFQEYMRSKNLPESVQRRVLSYFEFRFQRNYYKENEILSSLSNQLKQEIIVHTCGGLLLNTLIFKDIPHSFLVRISYSMKMEIFLPNDVVVSVGSDANAMFFILTGMVAVYDRYGKEVCHLADGGYFGETCLFISEEKRTASVVSIDFCEMYTLQKTDFLEAIAPYPDLLNKTETLAKQCLKEFLAQEEDTKYFKDDEGVWNKLSKPKLAMASRTRTYYNI